MKPRAIAEERSKGQTPLRRDAKFRGISGWGKFINGTAVVLAADPSAFPSCEILVL